MFSGYVQRSLDYKGRLCLCKSLRKELGRYPVVVKRGKHIKVYPESMKNQFRPSQIFEGRIDEEYRRLILPKAVLNSLPLGKKIILIGGGDHLEIRPRKRIPYSEIKIKEAKELSRRGIVVVADGDRKEVAIQTA